MTAGPRRVHGMTADGRWIVRYDGAGKWFVESYGPSDRYQIDFATAVRLTTEDGACAYCGVEGGSRFDAEVRKVLRARAA